MDPKLTPVPGMTQNSPQESPDGPGEPKYTGQCSCQESDGMIYCEFCAAFFSNPLKNKDLTGVDKQF